MGKSRGSDYLLKQSPISEDQKATKEVGSHFEDMKLIKGINGHSLLSSKPANYPDPTENDEASPMHG